MTNFKKGSRGKQVLTIQKALIAAGVKPRPRTSGTFDAVTEDAVKTFQQKNRLKVDGIVGKKTMPRLLKLAKGPRINLKMTAPNYASLLRKKSAAHIKTKKAVLKVLVTINRERDPAIRKIAKEYNHLFQSFVGAYDRWRTCAEKISRNQTTFARELRTDPWSAADIKKTIDADHASAHFEDRCIDGCLYGFRRLDKLLAKTTRTMAA